MKTGRRDSKESYAKFVEEYLPNHNDSMSLVLSRFQSIGIDVEGIVALLGTPCFLFLLIQDSSMKSKVVFIFCFLIFHLNPLNKYFKICIS